MSGRGKRKPARKRRTTGSPTTRAKIIPLVSSGESSNTPWLTVLNQQGIGDPPGEVPPGEVKSYGRFNPFLTKALLPGERWIANQGSLLALDEEIKAQKSAQAPELS